MRAPITLSLHLPNFNYPGVEPDGLFDHLVDIARTAEDSGFSSITVMDHLHQIPGIGPPENFMLEGNTILAALAARTQRVSVGLLVGGVTYRNPALLAKTTTTLDVISGGRAVLGLGAAWFQDEHEAYGFAFPPLKERFERLEEALRIARAMFTQESSSVEGRRYRTRNVLNSPRPLRGDIPIMVGGSGERKTLRLVAQYADACNIFGDVDRVRHLLGVLEGHCETVGRDPAEITKTRMGSVYIAPTHDEAAAKLHAAVDAGMSEERRRMIVMAGDPGEVAEQAQTFVDAGIEGLTVSMPDVYDLEMVRLVGETLGPVMGTPAGRTDAAARSAGRFARRTPAATPGGGG
jgi:F420-dependent oxidoreductase-like protein